MIIIGCLLRDFRRRTQRSNPLPTRTGFRVVGFQRIISLVSLALALTACAGDIVPPPAGPPTPTPLPQVVATALPPLGADGATIIANAPDIAPNNEAVIDTVNIVIAESSPVQVNAVVKGTLPDGCVKIERIGQERGDYTILATIITSRQPDAGCIAQLQSFEQVLPLDVSDLPPGTYTVTVQGTNRVSATFQLGGGNPQPATSVPPPLPTPVPVPANASISGVVWADFCRPLANGAPSAGCIPDGRGGFRADGTYSNGEAWIAGIQLVLRSGQCPGSDPALNTTTDGNGRYRFDNLQPGSYCVSIDALAGPNSPLLSAGDWTFPASGVGQANVVVEAGQNQSADFGWDDQFERAPTASTTCFDQATYVADVTIPDNTRMAPGESFVKTWRVRNIGTCTWDATYTLVFVGGQPFGGQVSVPLTQTVQPGGEFELSIPLVAPPVAGVYRGEWVLQNSSGVKFGSRGGYPFYVQIVVNGAAIPATPQALAVSGLVWEDVCQMVESGSPSGGCVLDGASGAYRADGLFNNGERGLAGVQVRLSIGECPGNNFVFITGTTDAGGAYRFTDLQAGPHCISIDASTEPNASLLLPGAWTYPAPGISSITVIAGEDQSQSVNFGWDYQLR